ncbi:MAG: hypothetical protein AB2A00_42940, partial [Myxococcota bacterium]
AVVAHSGRGEVVGGGGGVGVSSVFLLDSLAPGASGLAGASGPDAGLARIRGDDTFIRNAFLGMTTLVLLLGGAAASRRRVRLHVVLLVSALVLLVLSRGAHVPGMAPLLDVLASRFPDKLLLPCALAVILLAARAGSAILRWPPARALSVVTASLGVLGAVLLLGAGMMTSWLMATWGPGLTPTEVELATPRLNGAITQSAGILLCGSAVLLLASRRRQQPWVWLLLACGAAEGITSIDALNMTTPVARLQPDASPLPLAPVGPERVFVGRVGETFAGAFSLLSPTLDNDATGRIHLALGIPLTGTLRGASYPVNADVSRLEPARMRTLAQDALTRLDAPLLVNVLRRLGAERIILMTSEPPVHDAVAVKSVVRVGQSDTWVDMQVVSPIPTTTLETTWEHHDDLKAATLALAGSARVVVAPGVPPPPPQPDPAPTLETLEHTPTSWVMRTRATSESLLVVREVWDPGWTATLDGAPVPIHVVNVAQRGVHVPPGEHVVGMRFRVPNAKAGVVLGTLGLVLLAWRTRGRRSR